MAQAGYLSKPQCKKRRAAASADLGLQTRSGRRSWLDGELTSPSVASAAPPAGGEVGRSFLVRSQKSREVAIYRFELESERTADAARLNMAERRREMATLVAIGARSGYVVTAVVLRFAATAAVGFLLGIALGTAVGHLLQGPSFGTAPVVLDAGLATILLSALVAAPVAASAARADPVEALEER